VSVYSTWLNFEHPDQIAADLAEAGITYGVIGDDTPEREIGSPYVYLGSHIRPTADLPRGGSLEVGAVPNHCHPDADWGVTDTGDEKWRVEFLRIGVHEDPATYRHEDNHGDATVVLDRRQVQKLRNCLTRWLDAAVRW
jgi:hypothetical protein